MTPDRIPARAVQSSITRRPTPQKQRLDGAEQAAVRCGADARRDMSRRIASSGI
jgi:hypothetical protein